MRGLVIGMGTEHAKTHTFLRSIERSGFDGEVHIFTSDPLPWHPVVDRFKLISDYIAKGSYRNVIACDTYDVVFQSNPFEWLEAHLGSHDLVVVGEEKTFSECPENARGMRQSFPQYSEELRDKEILNAGVIAGSATFVALLAEHIYDLCQQDARLPKFTPGFEDRLPDQQALNILYPRGRELIAHGKDAFAFQYNHKHEFRDGLMYNENGQLYAILHQYLYQWGDEVRKKYLLP